MTHHILFQPWGGLGDNLQFSTLPERFAERGERFLISERNAVRNPEIHELVWGCNPFVAGRSAEEPTAGLPKLERLNSISWHHSFIERIEMAHGLEPRHSHPRIHYQPQRDPSLADAVLIDVGSTTTTYAPAVVHDYVSRMLQRYGRRLEDVRQVTFSGSVRQHDGARYTVAPLTIPSIFRYCDALASCKAFITVWSGAHALAAAIRGGEGKAGAGPDIHCLITANGFNSRIHQFPGVDYHIGG